MEKESKTKRTKTVGVVIEISGYGIRTGNYFLLKAILVCAELIVLIAIGMAADTQLAEIGFKAPELLGKNIIGLSGLIVTGGIILQLFKIEKVGE